MPPNNQPMPGRVLESIRDARGKTAFFLTILLGAVAVLGHAPFFIWPLFILAFAFFSGRLSGVAQCTNRPGRAAFWCGWAFGFGYFAASLYWLASAFITRGGGYVWLIPAGVILLPAALAFFWAFASLVYAKFFAAPAARLRVVAPEGFAVLFFGVEWLRGHILTGFPWNLPGYIWKAGDPISQSASWLGIYGLTFLTLLMASALGRIIFWQGGRFWRRAPLAFMVAVFIGLFISGKARLGNAKIDYVDGPYIRVVQAQIDQKTKYNPDYYSTVIDSYLDLSATPSSRPLTHIIWPEGALAGLVLEDQGLMAAFDQFFQGGPDLLMGVTRRVPGEGGRYSFYNSLVDLRPTGAGEMALLAAYDKYKLVPFSEYFPGNSLFTQWELEGLSAATASFDRGTRELTHIPGLPRGSVQICYEAIFPGFTPRPSDAPQAQYIINISNDSWFGKSTGPHQHFNQVRYRAIETGLPVIRSASSGFSGFVDPYGRMAKGAALDDNTVIDYRLIKPIMRK